MKNALVDAILAEADAKARKIITEGAKKAAELKKEHEAAALQKQKQFLEREKTANNELKKKELSKTNIELKKKLLDKKKEFIDKAFSQALDDLSRLDPAERKKLIQSLLSDALKELETAKYFYSNETDRKLIHSITRKISFAGKIDSAGGFILENKDKSVRINNTFEVLLEKTRESETSEVNKILFQ